MKTIFIILSSVIILYSAWSCKLRISESSSIASPISAKYSTPYVCVKDKSFIGGRDHPREGDWVVINLGKDLIGRIAGNVKFSKKEYFCGVRTHFVEQIGTVYSSDNFYFDLSGVNGLKFHFNADENKSLVIRNSNGESKTLGHCQKWPAGYEERTNPDFGFNCQSGE